MRYNYSIRSMRCVHKCDQHMESMIRLINGVHSVRIDKYTEQVQVEIRGENERIPELVLLTLYSIGYDATCDDDKSITWFRISNMTSKSCGDVIMRAVSAVHGVQRSVVSFDQHMLLVTKSATTSSTTIVNAIEEGGYDVVEEGGPRDLLLDVTGMNAKLKHASHVLNCLRNAPHVSAAQIHIRNGTARVRGAISLVDALEVLAAKGYSAYPSLQQCELSDGLVYWLLRYSSTAINSEQYSVYSSPEAATVEELGPVSSTWQANSGVKCSDGDGVLHVTPPLVRRSSRLSGAPQSFDDLKLHFADSAPVLGHLGDSRSVYSISGVTSLSNVTYLENLLLKSKGVQFASVGLLTEHVQVLYDSSVITAAALENVINSTGHAAKHLSTKFASIEDCCRRVFQISSFVETSVEALQRRFVGFDALRATSGVFAVDWCLSEGFVGRRSGATIVLSVTFDVDLVGLRSIYEMISISNPQLMIEILPLRRIVDDLPRSPQKTIYGEILKNLKIVILLVFVQLLIVLFESFDKLAMSGMRYIDCFIVLLSSLVQIAYGVHFAKECVESLKNRSLGLSMLVTVGSMAAFALGAFMLADSIFNERESYQYDDYFIASLLLVVFALVGEELEKSIRFRKVFGIKRLLSLQPVKSVLTAFTLPKNRNSVAYAIEHDDMPELSRDASQQVEVLSSEREILTELLEEDDIVKIVRGMTIPADGIIVQGQGDINECLVSGENMSVHRRVGDDVFGGAIVADGTIYVKVRCVGEYTVLGQLISLTEVAYSETTPNGRALSDRIGGVFAIIVIGLSVLVTALWIILLYFHFVKSHRHFFPIHLNNIELSLVIGITTLIIACPCALCLALPTAVLIGRNIAAKYGLHAAFARPLLKAAKITSIIFDKTGTLTTGMPSVSMVYVLDDDGKLSRMNCRDDGATHTEFDSSFKGSTIHRSKSLCRADEILWLSACAEMSNEHIIGRAIVRHVISNAQFPSLVEPHRSVTVSGRGIKCRVGEIDVVLGTIDFLREHHVKNANYSDLVNLGIEAENAGIIVVFVAIGGSLRAMIQLEDTPRAEVVDTIRALSSCGLKVWLFTGDHLRSATHHLGQSLGVPSHQIVCSALPSTKLHHIMNLQQDGEIVAYVGDGVGDAPALAQADLGITLGDSSDSALKCADLVLSNANISAILTSISLSDHILKTIKINIFLSLIFNILAVPFAAGGLVYISGRMFPPWSTGVIMLVSTLAILCNSLRLYQFTPPELPTFNPHLFSAEHDDINLDEDEENVAQDLHNLSRFLSMESLRQIDTMMTSRTVSEAAVPATVQEVDETEDTESTQLMKTPAPKMRDGSSYGSFNGKARADSYATCYSYGEDDEDDDDFV